MGVAVFPEDGENCEALLRVADAAMYRAKRDRTVTARAQREA
jgi:GGDEF domain-containing protein